MTVYSVHKPDKYKQKMQQTNKRGLEHRLQVGNSLRRLGRRPVQRSSSKLAAVSKLELNFARNHF